jgi:hypothetical protein
MKLISEEIKESELTEFQKMKKKLKNSKASEKEVIQKLLELKKTSASAIALLNYNDSVKLNLNASSGKNSSSINESFD